MSPSHVELTDFTGMDFTLKKNCGRLIQNNAPNTRSRKWKWIRITSLVLRETDGRIGGREKGVMLDISLCEWHLLFLFHCCCCCLTSEPCNKKNRKRHSYNQLFNLRARKHLAYVRQHPKERRERSKRKRAGGGGIQYPRYVVSSTTCSSPPSVIVKRTCPRFCVSSPDPLWKKANTTSPIIPVRALTAVSRSHFAWDGCERIDSSQIGWCISVSEAYQRRMSRGRYQQGYIFHFC